MASTIKSRAMSSPHVDSYRFGEIVIDSQVFNKDVIILPERVIPNWRRLSGHNLAVKDLKEVFDANPEMVLVGQGAHSRMRVPLQTEQALKDAGIEVITQSSPEVCKLTTNCALRGASSWLFT